MAANRAEARRMIEALGETKLSGFNLSPQIVEQAGKSWFERWAKRNGYAMEKRKVEILAYVLTKEQSKGKTLNLFRK